MLKNILSVIIVNASAFAIYLIFTTLALKVENRNLEEDKRRTLKEFMKGFNAILPFTSQKVGFVCDLLMILNILAGTLLMLIESSSSSQTTLPLYFLGVSGISIIVRVLAEITHEKTKRKMKAVASYCKKINMFLCSKGYSEQKAHSLLKLINTVWMSIEDESRINTVYKAIANDTPLNAFVNDIMIPCMTADKGVIKCFYEDLTEEDRTDLSNAFTVLGNVSENPLD